MVRELIAAFVIVAVCVVIHVVGIVLLADWLLDRRSVREQLGSMTHFTILLIAAFAVIILLHVAETGVWAVFYLWWGLFPDFETSLYFSLVSYTTIGYGDVVLPQKWRLLGGIEGISGALLCGLSTAFIFVVLNSMFKIRIQQQEADRK